MDELIRFLGGNYSVIDKSGYLIILTALALITLTILRGSLFLRNWINVLLKTLVCVTLLVVVLLVIFVKSNVEELQIPPNYQREKVAFSSEARLSGELLTPKNRQQVPALIFICGSDVSSYHTNYSRLLNEVIIPVFSEFGYAMLFYDKRGVGESDGDWMVTDFATLADDAYQGAKFLKARPEIDAGQITVVGHSQGGWIAQLVAARHEDIYAVASLAGPCTSVKEQIMDDALSTFICQGHDSTNARAKTQQLINELELKSKFAEDGRYKQYALTSTYKPDEAIARIRQPCLFMFGRNDRLVPLSKNLAKLHQLFSNTIPDNMTISIIENAGHSFRTMDYCFQGSQRNLDYSKQFIESLKSWVRSIRPIGTGL